MSNPLGLLLTIFCSSFFLGEIVHLGSLLGGALLVGGLYSVLWGKSKDHPPHPRDHHQEEPVKHLTNSISNDNDEEKQQQQQQQQQEKHEKNLKDLFLMEASPVHRQV
uniref:WAT1-related protein n=1 Tax=Arundo donax TaxID=35708 RepID=A0A0A9H750_ARUDO